MTGKKMQFWLSVAAALVAGVALRLWFIAHAARIDGDTLIYGDIAKNWLQHGIYGFSVSDAPPHPTLIRLPGYPLFLLVCFKLFGIEHYTAVMYLQAVIDLLTCLLLFCLARRLFGRIPALFTLWLAALCPFTASYVSTPLTETLSLACIAVAFYSVERWQANGLAFNRWLWIVSAALAYAILLRPEQGLLAATVLPAMFWLAWRPRAETLFIPRTSPLKRAAPIFLAAVCVLLPLVPWAARNWYTFHVVQPLAPRYANDPGESVSFGFQRWYRTWAIDFASTEDVYWNYDGDAIDISDLPTRTFDSDDQYARTEALLNDYDRTDRASPSLDARFAALAAERIKADPLRYYVALPIARLINMAFRPRTEMLPVELDWWNWREHPGQSAVAAIFAAINLAYFALAGWGLWLWHRARFQGQSALAWAMVVFILLRCALLLTLDNSEPRYTLEFYPVLLIWSAAVFASGRLSAGPPLSACPS